GGGENGGRLWGRVRAHPRRPRAIPRASDGRARKLRRVNIRRRRRIEQLLARCRSERPEALGNLRRRNGASVVILTPDLLVKLGDCLRDPPPHASFHLPCPEIKLLS